MELPYPDQQETDPMSTIPAFAVTDHLGSSEVHTANASVAITGPTMTREGRGRWSNKDGEYTRTRVDWQPDRLIMRWRWDDVLGWTLTDAIVAGTRLNKNGSLNSRGLRERVDYVGRRGALDAATPSEIIDAIATYAPQSRVVR